MKRIFTVLCLTLAWCGHIVAQNPLIETIRSNTQAQTFLQNTLSYTAMSVSEYLGEHIEICGQVLVDNRDETNRVATIELAQDGWSRRQEKVVASKMSMASVIGHIDVDQVDSLISVLSGIERRGNGMYPFSVQHIVKGGLCISYHSRAKELRIYTCYYSDEPSHSYFYNYDETGVSSNIRTGSMVVIKSVDEIREIIQALKQAKFRLENYMN
ncbi:MAG: hypothetical protein K6E86_03760 [Bacteroidales bacterium]|nr:hypothetical protein [Bacteroidales bacterium]